MALHIQKWGNSLGVRIPKAYADELHWDQNTEVMATVVEGKLILETAHTEIPKYDLDELLAGITPDMLHGETSTGHAVGNEEW
jgi:antitoxin MazE